MQCGSCGRVESGLHNALRDVGVDLQQVAGHRPDRSKSQNGLNMAAH